MTRALVRNNEKRGKLRQMRPVAKRTTVRVRRGSLTALAICLCITALMSVACSPRGRLAERGKRGFTQRGIASWYGPGFHGKQTANGEAYDMHALTAAHKELPFNTVVEVVNRDNGKTVRVRINDRGPFVRGRIIDLSRRAAERIDMVRSGTARVTLRVVEASASTSGSFAARDTWIVQAGAFSDAGRAEQHLRRVEEIDRRARAVESAGLIRIVVGPLSDERQARRLEKRLHDAGIDAIVRRPARDP